MSDIKLNQTATGVYKIFTIKDVGTLKTLLRLSSTQWYQMMKADFRRITVEATDNLERRYKQGKEIKPVSTDNLIQFPCNNTKRKVLL